MVNDYYASDYQVKIHLPIGWLSYIVAVCKFTATF